MQLNSINAHVTPNDIERAQRYQPWLLEGKPTVTIAAAAAEWKPDFKRPHERRTSRPAGHLPRDF